MLMSGLLAGVFDGSAAAQDAPKAATAKQGQDQQQPVIMRPPPDSYFQGLPKEFGDELQRYQTLFKSGKISAERYGQWAEGFQGRIYDFKQGQARLNSIPLPEAPPVLSPDLVR